MGKVLASKIRYRTDWVRGLHSIRLFSHDWTLDRLSEDLINLLGLNTALKRRSGDFRAKSLKYASIGALNVLPGHAYDA